MRACVHVDVNVFHGIARVTLSVPGRDLCHKTRLAF